MQSASLQIGFPNIIQEPFFFFFFAYETPTLFISTIKLSVVYAPLVNPGPINIKVPKGRVGAEQAAFLATLQHESRRINKTQHGGENSCSFWWFIPAWEGEARPGGHEHHLLYLLPPVLAAFASSASREAVLAHPVKIGWVWNAASPPLEHSRPHQSFMSWAGVSHKGVVITGFYGVRHSCTSTAPSCLQVLLSTFLPTGQFENIFHYCELTRVQIWELPLLLVQKSQNSSATDRLKVFYPGGQCCWIWV